MIVWLLAGCVGLIPFRNEAPRLRSVNGQPLAPVDTLGDRLDPFEPGEPYPLSLEVWDPEGHEILIWFPDAPGQIDFPPDGTEGVLHMHDRGFAKLWIVLEDLAHQPRQRTIEIDLSFP